MGLIACAKTLSGLLHTCPLDLLVKYTKCMQRAWPVRSAYYFFSNRETLSGWNLLIKYIINALPVAGCPGLPIAPLVPACTFNPLKQCR